jgi:FlaA1/EpsC-like NDP-sugar epimerase
VPLFNKQIADNKPLTLTHPEMTRFMLTLKDAMNLVFLAYKEGVGGEIFVKKSPAHTVKDLAEVMIEELGAKNKQIKVTGVRPGEKIHETLVSPTESLRTIEKKEHFIVLPQIKIPETEEKYSSHTNDKMFRFSSDVARRMTKEEIRKVLKENKWF